jgi:hypothetical protein
MKALANVHPTPAVEAGQLAAHGAGKTVHSIAAAGALNGLAQTLLRMTVPGSRICIRATSSGTSAWSIRTTAGRWITPLASRPCSNAVKSRSAGELA